MRRLILILTIVVATLPLSVVLGQQGRENTLIIAAEADATTFNPLFAIDGGSQDAGQYLWPIPFDIDPVSGLPLDGLTSWEISEDGLTYTFTIREDAVWSDDTPITSRDAQFTYEAAAADIVASPRQSQALSLGTINVIDDKSYQIVLDQVNCAVFGTLANLPWAPAHKFAPDFSDVADNPYNSFPDVSGGPWILEEWEPDDFQRYRANPTYWGGEPKIPTMIRRIMPETSVRIQSLAAGEADFTILSPDQFAQLIEVENFNVASFPAYEINVLIMNHGDPDNPQPAYDEDGNPIEQGSHPILGDVRVRQAIVMGYDKDSILETLGENGGTRSAASIIPTIPWAYNDELAPWPYDPVGAAELLDEAGWLLNEETGIREKDGVPLELTLLTNDFRPLYDVIALVAQDQLTDLGMDVTLTSLEFGTFVEQLLSQNFDLAVVSFGDFPPPDPNGITAIFLDSHNDVPGGGFNVASYVNPRMDGLIAEGLAVPGCATEERAPIYHEIQRITQEDVAYDFALTSNFFYVMNKRIQNFDPGPWKWDWNINQYTVVNGS